MCVLPNMAFLRAGKSFAPSHARCVHQTRKRHSSDANTHHLAPTQLHSRRMHAKVEEGFMERREGGRRRRRREKLNISQEKEGRGGGGGGGGGGFFSPHPSRGTDYISFPPFPYTRRITSCIKTPPHPAQQKPRLLIGVIGSFPFLKRFLLLSILAVEAEDWRIINQISLILLLRFPDPVTG